MEEQEKYESRHDIRISYVPQKIKKQLQIIARNMGLTFSGMMKMKMKEWIQQAPEYLKKEPKED